MDDLDFLDILPAEETPIITDIGPCECGQVGILCRSYLCGRGPCVRAYNAKVTSAHDFDPNVIKFMFDLAAAAAESKDYLNPLPLPYESPPVGTPHALTPEQVKELSRAIKSTKNAAMGGMPFDKTQGGIFAWIMSTIPATVSTAPYHGGELFRFDYSGSEEVKFSGDYLFHGTHFNRWFSIIRNGLLVLSGTKLMTTGSAYGNGIYLSDDIRLSTGYIGKSDAKYGQLIGIYEVNGKKSTYKKSSNIYVVPDHSLLRLRYILKVPSCNDASSILTYLQCEPRICINNNYDSVTVTPAGLEYGGKRFTIIEGNPPQIIYNGGYVYVARMHIRRWVIGYPIKKLLNKWAAQGCQTIAMEEEHYGAATASLL